MPCWVAVLNQEIKSFVSIWYPCRGSSRTLTKKATKSNTAKIVNSRLGNEKLTAFSPSAKYLLSWHKKLFPRKSRHFEKAENY